MSLRQRKTRRQSQRWTRGTIAWIRSNFPEPDKMTWEQRFEVIHRLVKEIEVQKTEDGYHLDVIPC